MWPFKSRKPEIHFNTPKALGVKTLDTTAAPSSVIIKPNHFSVETHVTTIRAMLEALTTQIAAAEKECAAEIEQHETNKRTEIERHSLAMSRIITKQSELETLQTSYVAALKIAAPGGDDGYGSMTGQSYQEFVDAVALSAVGARIAEIRDPLPPAVPTKPAVIKTRRKPISSQGPKSKRPVTDVREFVDGGSLDNLRLTKPAIVPHHTVDFPPEE